MAGDQPRRSSPTGARRTSRSRSSASPPTGRRRSTRRTPASAAPPPVTEAPTTADVTSDETAPSADVAAAGAASREWRATEPATPGVAAAHPLALQRSTVDVPESPREPRPAPATASGAARNRRRWPRWAGVAGIAVALVVLVALGAVALGRPGLGSSPGLSPTEAQASAPGHATLFDAPFDGLFVDASLPPPWTTTSTGSAQIVALPTSVDRSLRLRSDGSGTPVTVCRPILDVQPTSAIRVELDVMAESLPAATPSPVVTLRADGTDLASLGLDSKGALVDSGGQAASAIHAGAWYHLTLTLDRGAGTVTWQAVAADGSMIRPAAPSRAAGTSAVDAVCLLSPAGTRSGALVVNNLAVRE